MLAAGANPNLFADDGRSAADYARDNPAVRNDAVFRQLIHSIPQGNATKRH